MPSKTLLNIAGTKLTLSNLSKVFYPKSEFNKGQVIDYYIRISPFLLPHLANRPLTLKRYPNGANNDSFYQKQCPNTRPEWMLTAPIESASNKESPNYCVVDNLPGLVWVANMAALELHVVLSNTQNTTIPTMMVFDLDPGLPATIVDCAQVALWLQDFFITFNLQSYPKTSGSKGLQIYIPLNTPIDYSQTKEFAHRLAQALEKKFPDKVVSKMSKTLRAGKVLIDWSQNDTHKTTVCVYSLRAGEEPTVSTPVTWSEVEQACKNNDVQALIFKAPEVLERVKNRGDLFAPVLTTKQYLP